jgi:hypothetical protein
MTPEEQIAKAIDVAVRFGGIDGDHHKSWVIDQMVRALTDCPDQGRDALGESEAYKELVRSACEGEDGPDTYVWDIGIPP